VRSLVAGGTDSADHALPGRGERARRPRRRDRPRRAIASGTPARPQGQRRPRRHRGRRGDAAQLGTVGRILQRVTSGTPELDPGGRHASVRTAGGSAQLADVIRGLGEAGIGVEEIGLRRPTLDEVFLSLTGEHPAPPAPSRKLPSANCRAPKRKESADDDRDREAGRAAAGGRGRA